MRKRIPTLLALTLLIASVIFGAFLFYIQQNRNQIQKTAFQPQNILATNITSTSATIIWHTTTPVIGVAKVTNKTAFSDDRDLQKQPTPRYSHSVTLQNLEPNTTYTAEIENNGFTFSDKGLTFTTISQEINEKASLNPGSSPIRGTILTSSQTPVTDAIVVLNMKEASPKSTFVTATGNYVLPTTKLINASLTDTIALSASQQATLEIRSGNNISFAQISLPIKNHTLPAITLGRNENFTAFLSQPAPTPIALEFKQTPQNYDLNNDGKINTLDSSLLSDLIAKNQFVESADFNNDRSINEKDLDFIKQNLQ